MTTWQLTPRNYDRMKALIFSFTRAFDFELAVPPNEVTCRTMIATRPYLVSNAAEGSQLPIIIRLAESEWWLVQRPDRLVSSFPSTVLPWLVVWLDCDSTPWLVLVILKDFMVDCASLKLDLLYLTTVASRIRTSSSSLFHLLEHMTSRLKPQQTLNAPNDHDHELALKCVIPIIRKCRQLVRRRVSAISICTRVYYEWHLFQ